VRERENHISNYTDSLLTRATSSSQKTTEIPLCNRQHITNTHTNKEVILTSQEHSPSLIHHTHKVRTPSNLTVPTIYKYTNLKTITKENRKYYSFYRKSQLILFHSLTNAKPKQSCNLHNLSKCVLNLIFLYF